MTIAGGRAVKERAKFQAIFRIGYLSDAEQLLDPVGAKWVGMRDDLVQEVTVLPELVQKLRHLLKFVGFECRQMAEDVIKCE